MLYYAILIVLYFTLCVLIAYLGRRRKWGYWGYLWSAILFTPLMGILFVLAADPRPGRPPLHDDNPASKK